MAVIKEFCCIAHGDFEGTHPICPSLGCDSSEVTRVFLTPITIGKASTKRFDAGIRRTSDMMQIRDFKGGSRQGDVSFAGRAGPNPGTEVLWGDTAVKKAMGHSFAELSNIAAKPLTVRTGEGTRTLTRNNGMADAAESAGITSRSIPRAGEVVVPHVEKAARAKAQAMTT